MNESLHEDDPVLENEITLKTRTALRRLLPILREHRRRLLICLGLLLGTTLFSLAWPWLIQMAIDGPITRELKHPEGARVFGGVLAVGLGVLLLQTGTLILQYLQRLKLETIGQDVMLTLKTRLFDHILTQDISFFDASPVGKLMARVESDAESLRMLFTNTVVLVVGDLILVLGIWGLMFWKEPRLATVVLLSAPLILGLMYIFHRLTTHRFLEVRKKMAEVTATLTEFLHGMSIIQIFHRGEYARRTVYAANKRKFDHDAYVGVGVCVFFNTLFAVESLKIGLILLLGAAWHVSPGVIVLFILLIWKEFDPIARTADQLGTFQKGLAGARRIFALLSVEPKLRDPARPSAWNGLGEGIRFEHVWFSYTDKEDWVLRDVSFEIPVGKSIGLVGVTGGGKSTIISLLLRLYDPQRGRITVDGIDLRDLNRETLRSRFALVLQDIFLFPGDVESNIALEAETVSHEEVAAAARTVAADPFIRKLPKGYHTEVSEKGANFSRGERQLLSFARALAVDPDVLVLDEATSSVDPATERQIQTSLAKLMRGRTSLIVAHRLSTILGVDQILVLRDGQIVERGRHKELLARNGYYARLYQLQFAEKTSEVSYA